MNWKIAKGILACVLAFVLTAETPLFALADDTGVQEPASQEVQAPQQERDFPGIR